MTMNRKMMRQAQQLQKQLADTQQEVEISTVEANSGGGVVKVVANGKMLVESVSIDPDVVSPDDVEMLEDLVTAAVNEALGKAQKMANDKMSALTQGLGVNLSGLI